jgi:hypothetical protein
MLLRRNFIAFLVSLRLFGLVGCSSTGYSTTTNLVVPKTIRTPTNIPPEIVPYVPRFVELIQANGFSVGKTNDPRALDLVFEFNPSVVNLRFSVGLWRQGIPILSASATNSGWGTLLARGSAENSLADSAFETFKRELQQLVSHTQIVNDSTDGNH